MSNRSSRKKQFTPPRDIPAETRKMAEQLASQTEGVRPEDFRYAEYRFHDGRSWTVKASWERFVHGEWQPIDGPLAFPGYGPSGQ